MPRRKRRNRGEPKEPSSEEASAQVSGTASKRSRRSRGRKRFTLDVAAVSKEVASEVIKRLGLDLIGVSADDIIDIVEDIVSGIAESRSTKPSVDSLVKRILASKDQFKKAVAARLLERKGEELNLEQLEFVVANAPELAGRSAPILYRVAKRLKAEHIILALQTLWNKYGLRTPIRCPRCGFYAVTPDLTCMVCGASLEEEEIKKSISFRERLESFLQRAPTPLVREIYQAGFVLLDDEIHPPSMPPSGFKVEVHLNREERLLVKKFLEEREESQGS